VPAWQVKARRLPYVTSTAARSAPVDEALCTSNSP